MKSFVKFFIIIFYTNSLSLRAQPIDQGEELACSAQDDKQFRSKRSALSSKYPKWPNSTVPYYIACPNFNEKELHLLKSSLQEIQQKTCVKFVQMEVLGKYENYINVECKPENGCRSLLGYKGHPQPLNLKIYRKHGGSNGDTCMIKRIIQHEFMHALGFKHEHNSPVRDKYVRIITKNIAEGWDYYFTKSDPADFDSYGCPYDYNSIMQVNSYRHSKSKNLPTIKPLDKSIPLDALGKVKSVSECDIKRINNMYCNVDVTTSKDKVNEVTKEGLSSEGKKSDGIGKGLGSVNLLLDKVLSFGGAYIKNAPDLILGPIKPLFG